MTARSADSPGARTSLTHTGPRDNGRPARPGQLADGANGSELNALGAELHDRVISELAALIVEMEQFKRDQYNRSGVQVAVAGFQSSTRSALAQLRDVIQGLQLGSVDLDDGLEAALRTGPLTEVEARNINACLTVSRRWPRQLDAFTAIHLYRIVEQALRNVVDHSGAQRVTVALRAIRDELVAEVSDDGAGFPWAHSVPGQGTAGMERRAVLLGGQLEFGGNRGGGALVRVRVPRRQR